MVDDDRGDDEMDEQPPQEEPQAEAQEPRAEAPQEGPESEAQEPEAEAQEPEAEAREPEAEAQEPEAEAAPEEAGDEAAEGEAWEEPPPPADVNVFDLLRAAIGLFVQEALIAMGVQARPGATEVATDLHCAHVAIDTTQMMIDKLGDEASAEERREFEQVMTDLRINFVRRQAKM